MTSIARAVAILREGGVVAFPTETVYGLGADAENTDAVRRVFAIKGRPRDHPLIVHIGDLRALASWSASVPSIACELAERFWPGPLTMILPRHRRVPDVVTGGLPAVGLRVPDHPLALSLLEAFGGGIAAPSANRFGSLSPTTAAHVRDDLGDAVDLILDGGACRVGLESTVVDLSSGRPSVLRVGGVTVEDLEAVVGASLQIDVASHARGPRGREGSRYAPRAEVIVTPVSELAEQATAMLGRGRRVAVAAGGTTVKLPEAVEYIRLPDSPAETARELYAVLREVDRRGCDVVLVAEPPRAGIGRAIADRLQRAAVAATSRRSSVKRAVESGSTEARNETHEHGTSRHSNR